MFEMLDNFLSCGVPSLIISVLEVFSCLFCRNHLSTISTYSVSVAGSIKKVVKTDFLRNLDISCIVVTD